ncbi:MAG: class I SAM-dependent methyltransferase [Puniceicoccales bacterium]|jgi:ubiquinone/menaquinone biosynthesis C-methylase UbiE|nr:class I SAM-dependent methyltransferase [Puniceicoccales bacterium]
MQLSDSEKNDEKVWYQKQSLKNTGSYRFSMGTFPKYLQKPYRIYETMIHHYSLSQRPIQVLDLCCGMGEFTFLIAELINGTVLGVDYSPESIQIAVKELEKRQLPNLRFEVGDVERCQFEDGFFDMICMSGSLSYLNLDVVLGKICRWLKPDGAFIAVDTYGYNPLFNLKRQLNYWFHYTTKQTVAGVPKKPTLDKIRSRFQSFEIEYCGTFAFMGPVLRYLIGETYTAKWVDKLDEVFPFLKKYAFKFVFCAKGPKVQK